LSPAPEAAARLRVHLRAAASSNGSFIARRNPDEQFRPTFGLVEMVSNAFGGYADSVNCIVLQPDGKILVGGG
jgi:hypothetical protein